MIKRTVLSLVAAAVLSVALASSAQAGEWMADPSHSIMEFKVRHFFSKTGGRFEDWAATINFDPEHLEKGSVEVTIQATSINTDSEDRDNHLRSPDFFDVEEFPTIVFKSTKVEKTDTGYLVTGNLDMHGVSKEISFPFTYNGSGPDAWGGTRAGFSAELEINRKDWNISWNKTMDAGGAILGENVTITIEIEAVAKPS